MKTASPRLSLSFHLLPIVAALLAACAQEPAPASPAVPADLLAGGQAFVAVPKGSGAESAGSYLAIRKDVLDGRSFRLVNGKLFVFDVLAPRSGGPVTDPPALLHAYPVVDLPALAELPGADRYVLIDPSAGDGFKPGPDPIDPAS